MRALFRVVRRVGLVALAGLVLATPAVGQTGLATVTGLVADSSGAAVPGVTVTATNQATNIAYTGITNDAGNYVITSVPIGEYIISAGLTGFKGVQSKVTLSVAQTARVDFKMEVGNIQERVDVFATGAVLQTENAVVGIKADREQVEKLPAISRNVSFVTMYAPGVTQPQMSSFNSLSGGGRPYVNGQLQQANNFTIDGVDTNEAINNSIAYQPSPDAVEQVSVETNNYSAELGNVTGAVVNMVIKSGTNQIRGNGFYYWRDNALAATPWATNRLGGEKSDYNRDIFGGTDRRPAAAEQAVLLRRLSGRTTGNAADQFVRDGGAGRLAAGRSQQPARPHHPDRRPRSADGAAVPEQPDSGLEVQCARRAACLRMNRSIRARTSRGHSAIFATTTAAPPRRRRMSTSST